MTISDMHIGIKLELDKSSALELPAFEPEEIDYWINRVILDYVKEKCKNIETDQSYIDDLKTLIQTFTTGTLSTSIEDTNLEKVIVDISSIEDVYLRLIKDEVLISFTDSIIGETITKKQGVSEITHDNFREYVDNPYSEHRLHYGEARPLRYFSGSYIILYTDRNYDITEYSMDYIRKPGEVSIATSTDCDLPAHTHSEIVKLTALTLIENIESNRSQTYLRVNKIN